MFIIADDDAVKETAVCKEHIIELNLLVAELI
jgi:hypothetical protein